MVGTEFVQSAGVAVTGVDGRGMTPTVDVRARHTPLTALIPRTHAVSENKLRRATKVDAAFRADAKLRAA